jgi:hypothetical protein
MSKIALTPSATGTGVFTISSPATNTDRTLTLPDEAGSIVVNTATGIDVTGTVVADGLTVDGRASVNQNMTNGSVSAFTNPHLALKSANSTDTTGFVGMSFATSDTANYGFSLGSQRTSAGQGDLVVRNHFNSAQGTKKLSVADNGDISFYEDTGTTAKFFWDASAESLGIGTVSPSATLDVKDATTPSVRIGNSGYIGNDSLIGSVDFWNKSPYEASKTTAQIEALSGPSYGHGGLLTFSTTTAGLPSGSLTERMRIDSSGNLLVGTTTIVAPSSGHSFSVGNGAQQAIGHNGSSSGTYYSYYSYNGSVIGSITQSGTTSVAYNTSSDYRLKTDAQPMTGASDRVLALKPVNFEWISSGERVDGFLAHEAQAVVPECVTGTKDAMRDEEYEVTAAIKATYDEDGNELTAAVEAVMGTRSVPDYQGIDQSKLVPLLTAALQEALTEISALKVRVAALEAV